MSESSECPECSKILGEYEDIICEDCYDAAVEKMEQRELAGAGIVFKTDWHLEKRNCLHCGSMKSSAEFGETDYCTECVRIQLEPAILATMVKEYNK